MIVVGPRQPTSLPLTHPSAGHPHEPAMLPDEIELAHPFKVPRHHAQPTPELSRVWMHPDHARLRLWARAVEALIQKRYSNLFSMLLLNAWPADHKAAKARQLDWRGLNMWNQRRTSIGRHH